MYVYSQTINLFCTNSVVYIYELFLDAVAICFPCIMKPVAIEDYINLLSLFQIFLYEYIRIMTKIIDLY